VPFQPFPPSPTYTPYPPGMMAVEAVPLAEGPRPTLAPGGVGGPSSPTPIPVAQTQPDLTQPQAIPTQPPEIALVPSLTPVPVAQGPTLSPNQMTATQIVYEATATSAAVLGIPFATWTPAGFVQQPGQPVGPAAQFPPNATVVTATPIGVAGICNEYEIRLDETLYAIAARYGVTVSQIAQANNIVNADLIKAGDTLLIPCPVPATPIPQTVPAQQGGAQPGGAVGQTIHVVQAGENLYQISLQYGVTMSSIAAANGLTTTTQINILSVGQQLVIPLPAITPTPGGVVGAPTPYIIIITNTPTPGF
jgi:LysM repeat protein